MEKVGIITEEDLDNIKTCIKIAKKVKKLSYDFVGVSNGKMFGTDGNFMMSYQVGITSDFKINKKDAEIMVLMGAGELMLAGDKPRAKYIAGDKGYVFSLQDEPTIEYTTPFKGLSSSGFNVPIGDIKAAISLSKVRMKEKGVILMVEANSVDKVVNLFTTNGEVDWEHSIPCKVAGSGLAHIDRDGFEKMLNVIPNNKLKFMFGKPTFPCTINNNHAIKQIHYESRTSILKMSNIFESVKKYIV